jgi:hypothetical protein
MYNTILSFFEKMSTSNAAAIRRRTNLPQTVDAKLQQQSQSQNQPQQQNSGNINSQGLTLPQVIAVVDKRLLALESFVKESKESVKNQQYDSPSQQQESSQTPQVDGIPKDVFNAIVNEFNNRFEIIAFEINSMKDTVLKLQTYTMDVNKMLLEERSNVNNNEFANLSITDVNTDAIDNLENVPEESDETQ